MGSGAGGVVTGADLEFYSRRTGGRSDRGGLRRGCLNIWGIRVRASLEKFENLYCEIV